MRSYGTCVFLLFAFLGSPWLRAQSLVHVSSFGAIPDDGVNDIPAIRNAIANLPASDAILEFSPGTYDLMPVTTLGAPTTSTVTIFSLFNKVNLTIRGNGATLLCHEFTPFRPFGASYYNLFQAWGCTDIEFQDLTVNMSRLPYTMGTCTQVVGLPTPLANRSFRVTIDPSFVPPGGNLLQMKIHALVNWRNGAPNGQTFFYVAGNSNGTDLSVVPSTQTAYYDIHGSTAQGNPGRLMMANLKTPPPPPAPYPLADHGLLQLGDDVVIAHQFSHYIAFLFVDCTRSFLTNLTVHSWPGMAVNMLRDQDIVIDGLQVVPDPQRPWPISTTADAIHIANISGSVQLQGCHLEGMLDDGFNSYTNLLVPTANQPPLPVTMDVVPNYVGWTYPAGATWEFYDSNMIPLGTRTLTTVSTNLTNPDRHRLTFGSLPTGAIAYLCNLDQFPSSTELNGTSVVCNRGHGFRLQRDTIVAGCTFDRVSGHGLEIGPSIGQWNEGPGGGGILVEDSTFQSCNRGWGLGDYQEGTINIRMATSIGGWHAGPYGALSNFTLRNLSILDSGGAAVVARSADSLTIDQCSFGSCSDLGVLLTGLPLGVNFGQVAAQSLLYFHDAGNIMITNNQVLPGASFLNGDRYGTIFGTYTKTNNVGF